MVISTAAFALFLFSGPQIAIWLKALAVAWIAFLDFLAEQMQVPNPGEFVTILVAEILAFLFAGLLNLFIIRRIVKQHDPPAPEIVVRDGLNYTVEKGKSTMYTLFVLNRGDTAALSCQARIEFDSLEERDILDIPKVKSRINLKSFDFVSRSRSTLPWIMFPQVSFPQAPTVSEEMNIRSGDKAEIGVLRVIPTQRKIPAHLEVPSTIQGEVTVCLRLKHFYGKVKITPLNGEPESRNFQITTLPGTNDWCLTLT
jgi:hypothetical protein